MPPLGTVNTPRLQTKEQRSPRPGSRCRGVSGAPLPPKHPGAGAQSSQPGAVRSRDRSLQPRPPRGPHPVVLQRRGAASGQTPEGVRLRISGRGSSFWITEFCFGRGKNPVFHNTDHRRGMGFLYQGSPERETGRYIPHIAGSWGFIGRNWFMQLWRQAGPRVCLAAGNLGKPMVCSLSLQV